MTDETRDIDLEQRIDAYIKGKLTEEQAQQLWVELLKHPEYIDLLQTEVDLARLHEARDVAEPATLHYWKWIAAAAAVVLFTLLATMLLHQNASPAIQQWALGDIDLVENIASSPVTRSGDNSQSVNPLLIAGFKAATSGNTDKAIITYKEMIALNITPTITAKAYFNLGILHYNTGLFEKSVGSFRQVLSIINNKPYLKEQTLWFLSNALIQNRQYEEARDTIQKVYEMDGVYKGQAFELLARLDYQLGAINLETLQQKLQKSE